jgi:hypothetical protein
MLRTGIGPATAQLRQAEVSSELPAAVPDDPATFRRVVRQAHGVPSHLTRACSAIPLADGDPSLGEAGEELLRRPCSGRRGAYLAAQGHPGRFSPPAPGRLLRLGAGGTPRGGAIRRGGNSQLEPPLGLLAGFPHAIEVIPGFRPGAVLAGQGRYQVNVICGVLDRDPPHPHVITFRIPPGAVHDARRDLRPLGVGEHPVLGGGADRVLSVAAAEYAAPGGLNMAETEMLSPEATTW